ncbi:amidohydrolase family protein [Tessaracoccus sp. OS52]|uniref:amidohydrolase family protein n=1 Tax=Tessaracoccus sp. OS52 TaxID=2886691 RepID=UPI001D124F2D|nr:amidohydrolase family protein [Tessaracoccus sp. OS52]MCC2593288.1 amidohydrolase family protein [Tessaracoccus sp. OS52]
MTQLHPVARTRHVVDTHAHVGPYFFHMGQDDVNANHRLCARWGIDLQLVSHSRGVFHDAAAGNAELARVLEGSDLLRGYVVINARDLVTASSELERWLQPGSPFVGVKMHTHYANAPISSPQVRDALQLLDDFDTVLLIHTWGADVLELARLLEPLRTLRAIAGHMGADRWDLAAEAATHQERLYLEPSCSVALGGQMAHVMRHAPRQQVLFGTDATLLDPSVAFGQVAAADLTADELEDVMWRNAHRLFGERLGSALRPV